MTEVRLVVLHALRCAGFVELPRAAEISGLPMAEVENYIFAGPDGAVTLVDLSGDKYQLVVQNVMFAPSWDEGCPSCTWAVDNLPHNMSRLSDEAIAFAMISQAPIEKLEAWRAERGWDHLWVSSYDTSYHDDWGWTRTGAEGKEGQAPGYSYYLLKDGTDEDLLPAVRAVASGKPFFSPAVTSLLVEDYVRTLQKRGLNDSYHLLTDREKEVLHLLAEGRSNKEVATLLDLGLSTVETHRANLMQKLNLHNTAEIVLYAVRKGIIV